MERLNPQKPKTGSYPIIFDERISSSLIGHLLAATNGAMIARGSSWAKDLLGEQVLPNGLSLIEDPTARASTDHAPLMGKVWQHQNV